MGHYCWVCGRTRANEKFSGRGHARHICRECARLPREERERAQALMDIEGFLHQSNVSARNIARLKRLCGSPSEEVRRKAALVLAVAETKPHKRRRISFLSRQAPDLLDRLVEEGLLPGFARIANADDRHDQDGDERSTR